jgi:hypothetical protein
VEPVQGRSHVFRLRRDDGRSAVLKRREEGRHGDFGVELATLEYLNAMPEPVAPQLLGADTEAGIMLMEDLGPGPSLADSLLAGQFGQARADLIAYARALGRLHAWSGSRGAELAALRARYAPGATLEPAWIGAIERGRAAFLGVAAGLGLATDGVEDEISGPADVAVPALDSYRVQVTAGTNDLGPDWNAAMAAAVAGWIIARGTVMASALDEDRRPWGTTEMRPRLVAWMRSLTGAASQAGVLPRLRALTSQLAEELSERWPEARVPDYPALARPGALLVQVPGWWLPEG